ncbi:MAG: topoisomerase DNA-binding C4 zinc finger domain-containing protein, partial [Pseudomonadales bacterium]
GRLKPSFKTHVEHAAHVKAIVEKKEEAHVCPKCGNGLVLRTSKRGANAGSQFWGCESFPKCRAIVPLES